MQLSIIIVNFNTRDLIANCINSIHQTVEKVKFEIIVVDNNSSDKSVEYIKNQFPRTTIIRNNLNHGFGKANNQGAKIASGDFLLFLNSDTILKENSIDQIFKLSNFNSSTIYGCRLLNNDNSVQPSAGFIPTLPKIFTQMFFIDDIPFVNNLIKSYQQTNLSFYQKNQTVDWVTGAFLLISKKLFQDIKGFDENIFMYGEELDLCLRAQKNGAKIKFLTKPEIFHLKGASSKDGFQKAILGEYKGLIYIYKKHFPNKVTILKLLLKIGALLRILIFAIINPSKSKIYQKAYKLV